MVEMVGRLDLNKADWMLMVTNDKLERCKPLGKGDYSGASLP